MRLRAACAISLVCVLAAWSEQHEIPADSLAAALSSALPSAVDLYAALEQRSAEHYAFLADLTPVAEDRQIYRLIAEKEKKDFKKFVSWKNNFIFKPTLKSEVLNQLNDLISERDDDSLNTVADDSLHSGLLVHLISGFAFEKKLRDLNRTELKNAPQESRIVYKRMIREEDEDIAFLSRLIDIACKPQHVLTSQEFSRLEQGDGD
jgi:rubrerythrin